MKIINKNEFKIMYGMDFLNPNEPTELKDKIAKKLLEHPNVEEFVAVEDVKKIEEENKKLKEELAKQKKEENKKAKK